MTKLTALGIIILLFVCIYLFVQCDNNKHRKSKPYLYMVDMLRTQSLNRHLPKFLNRTSLCVIQHPWAHLCAITISFIILKDRMLMRDQYTPHKFTKVLHTNEDDAEINA